jgi:hypothetical protein
MAMLKLLAPTQKILQAGLSAYNFINTTTQQHLGSWLTPWQAVPGYNGGEFVTRRYFHRKAVLSITYQGVQIGADQTTLVRLCCGCLLFDCITPGFLWGVQAHPELHGM